MPNYNSIASKLREAGACIQAVEYIKGLDSGKPIKEVWAEMEFGTWMLWLWLYLRPNDALVFILDELFHAMEKYPNHTLEAAYHRVLQSLYVGRPIVLGEVFDLANSISLDSPLKDVVTDPRATLLKKLVSAFSEQCWRAPQVYSSRRLQSSDLGIITIYTDSMIHLYGENNSGFSLAKYMRERLSGEAVESLLRMENID